MNIEKRYPAVLLGTACTPWDEQFRFDEAIFRRQVRYLLAEGVNHIYLFGTAGEGYAVNDRQYAEIVRAFAEEAAGEDACPMVGLISLSEGMMLDRMETAYAMGIREFQFALPSWGELSDAEIIRFFHDICDRYPDCRFMHYNSPKAKRLVSPQLYRLLAEEIPNLAAVKFPTHDLSTIHDIVGEPSPIQYFLAEFGYGYGSQLGECGLLMSSGVSRIALLKALFAAGADKDMAAIAPRLSELRRMDRKLRETVGSAYVNGVYDKLRYKLVDPAFPLRMLPPYSYPEDGAYDRFRAFLETQYPHWLPDISITGGNHNG